MYPERTTILFFDDWYLAQREYVERQVGPAEARGPVH